MSDVFEKALKLHEELEGKLTVELKTPLESKEDLSLVYSPGVAEPCRAISADRAKVYRYTGKGNTIAVISDGSAVLGLGNIGPEAALPVMEGKCCLFKRFGDVNAFPLVLDTQDTEEIIRICKMVSPGLGGINLEDISSPRCIEIETRLKKELDIPVFHDDQHGTTIVVIAGLINALKLVGKKWSDCTVVMSGLGAAGSSILRMLNKMGVANIYGFRSKGILNRKDVDSYTNPLYKELAMETNKDAEGLTLEEAMAKADIFIGVSVPNKVTPEMVRSMKHDPIIFALANPDPEIDYDLAKEAGARVVGTGRSDYPNQVNNVLAFPGLFKGALDVHSTAISEEMKLAAAQAIADIIPDEEIREDYVIPSPFDEAVPKAVAKAVGQIAIDQGLARKE